MYNGLYINLDRSPDRRAEMEIALALYHLGGRYRRFAAADGNILNFSSPYLSGAALGCFTSHYLALKQAPRDQHLHLIEDDVIFAPSTEQTILRVIESGTLDDYDVLFADTALPLLNDTYRWFKSLYDSLVTFDKAGAPASAAFQILGIDKIVFTTASSLIINKNSLDKLCKLYLADLESGSINPVDIFLREHARAGTIKAGCIFPFITSVRVEHTMTSTVRKVPDVTMRYTAADIARYSFFIGCDWQKCRELLEQLIPLPPASDRHAQILAHVLAFSLIDKKPELISKTEAA